MAGTVYKVIELVGTSADSWEDAARTAVVTAGQSLRDLRIAVVVKLVLQLDDNGEVCLYRSMVCISFKHEAGG